MRLNVYSLARRYSGPPRSLRAYPSPLDFINELSAIRSGCVVTAVHAEGDRIIAAVKAAIRQAQPARLASVADAAVELGISQCSVRRHVADGSLPSRRVGARVLVDLSQPASDGDLFMQQESPPSAVRRGVDPDTTRATPQRRRGGPQS